MSEPGRPIRGRLFCFWDKRNGTGPEKMDTGETGRFRRFTREMIAERGDSLDIAWLKDESEGGAETLPEPAVLAREAMTELEGALEELRGILLELGEELEETEEVV